TRALLTRRFLNGRNLSCDLLRSLTAAYVRLSAVAVQLTVAIQRTTRRPRIPPDGVGPRITPVHGAKPRPVRRRFEVLHHVDTRVPFVEKLPFEDVPVTFKPCPPTMFRQR